ncbi:hypothetical protein [Saprospira grandis]|uniref:Uncharacterized protein n=1 Tax=Saprospira grandis (strain Lewin) TaxID=984262 RepID=H6L1Y6_SAPGL|nr:hypothetical protein [Saprospira grandis]AFC23523.1 hypothetical protein SGRA_0785 [Saprospira grandis str. Lewin]WBM75192.1 hypothetical protein OP864_02895 [Saprospira grandis]
MQKLQPYLTAYQAAAPKRIVEGPAAHDLHQNLQQFKFDLLVEDGEEEVYFIYCDWDSPSLEQIQEITELAEDLPNLRIDLAGPIWKTSPKHRAQRQQLRNQLRSQQAQLQLLLQAPTAKFLKEQQNYWQKIDQLSYLYSMQQQEQPPAHNLRQRLQQLVQEKALLSLEEWEILQPYVDNRQLLQLEQRRLHSQAMPKLQELLQVEKKLLDALAKGV